MENFTNAQQLEKTAVRISFISIIINLILSGLKLLAGLLAHSQAMISDAIHSASDVFSTIIVIIGIRISSKKADSEHPYGHERLECVAALLLAFVLAATGALIGYSGLTSIAEGSYKESAGPGLLAAAAAAVSIFVKEIMYRYTIHFAKKANSASLKADAWHHRSDALSSVGALAGIIFSRLGYPIMDAAASLVICIFIFKAARDIFKDAVDKLVDHSADKMTESAIKGLILSDADVRGISVFRSRLFGSRLYLDVEIEVDGDMKLSDAHKIAEDVHNSVESRYPRVKHCMIHVNPASSLTPLCGQSENIQETGGVVAKSPKNIPSSCILSVKPV